MYILRSVAGW